MGTITDVNQCVDWVGYQFEDSRIGEDVKPEVT